jgi:hypothetical protein
MTDPKPLGEPGGDEATEFERTLLRSWKHESPPASARARALAIAGLAAGTSAAPPAHPVPAPKAAAGKLLAVVKWSLGAVISVGILGAGAALLRPSAPPFAALPSAPTSAVAPSEPPVAPAPTRLLIMPATNEPPPLQTSAPTSTAAAVVAGPPRRPPRSMSAASGLPPAPTASVAPSDALGEQVARIDHARDTLGAGDAATCLSELDAFDQKFPRSVMSEEATVLRIEALLRIGNRARATDLAERFLTSRPTSPHASGVRALLGATTNP